MKRLAFVAAAVLAIAACSKADNAAKTDTTPPAMAPAPAPAAAPDTGMKMGDTTHKMDSTAMKDTTKKP
jgi:hypothetical protein